MGGTDGMQRPFAIILSVEFVIGILGNGFIALVNCMDWIKGRKLSSVDQLLTALAISRISVLCSVFINVSAYVFYSHLLKAAEMTDIAFVVTNHFNMWLTTCLSILYFLKIAVFSNPIFLFLKRRIEKVVSMILLASLVLLSVQLVVKSIIRADAWGDGLHRNRTCSSSWSSLQFRNPLLITSFMLMSVPFIVALPAFLLLIFSLWKHLKKMRPHARDISTDAHIKALKAGFAFLLLCTAFLISLAAHLSSWSFLECDGVILFGQVIGMTFPSCHSWMLVFGNSKLRRASLSALSWLRCRDKDADPTGP